MKRTQVKKGPPSTDLLVCFPTRSHLTMMPKMICSPSRLSSMTNHNHSHYYRGKSGGEGGLWLKKNPMGSELSEPTSPKVTCVGQIKARPKSRSCKNWQTVMEEIERIHNNKKHVKKPSWGDTIGFKKEPMQFLACLRSFKFDLGCFGAFQSVNITSDDDDDDGNDYDNDNDSEANSVKKIKGFGGYDHDHDEDNEDVSSRSAFSKWLMVLKENQDFCMHGKEENEKLEGDDDDDDNEAQVPCEPPSNALLLMRCRSAPTKSISEDDNKEDDNNDHDDVNGHVDDYQHDVGKKRENLMELMKYEGDFYKLSCDIAKETWIAGDDDGDDKAQVPCEPPSNALLLTRCRSAPTKSISEDDNKEDDNNDHDDVNGHVDDYQHDVGKKRENLMELMKYEGDFYKLSCDIAKETWIAGGINNLSSITQTSKICSIESLQEVNACLQ
ncbi:hypothetical protein E3N88_26361 [Mikania micrantha]|uniref:ARID domain-containing protein n=1 Tax=Mikania micrantha TaxID=192012 RepID=A0A5N6N8D8_9ASTR|nr:hypothetical protein E3N88_26361 [Mikania micrantha]